MTAAVKQAPSTAFLEAKSTSLFISMNKVNLFRYFTFKVACTTIYMLDLPPIRGDPKYMYVVVYEIPIPKQPIGAWSLASEYITINLVGAG